MKAQQYAEAIYLAAEGKSDTELEQLALNVRELLGARGHIRLLASIVYELERLDHVRQTSDTLSVRVARPQDVSRFEMLLQKDIATLGATTLPREVVHDDTVIGGYEVRACGVRIDRTHKRVLVDLYSAMTAR